MGLFDKPEVIVLKETSDAKDYLSKLKDLQKDIAPESKLAKIIEKEIAITQAGIIGEDAIMYELKNSGMDLVVLHDIYIETADGRGAQIDYFVVTPYVNVFIECKNLYGDIEINSKGDFIRTVTYGRKKVREGIYSPITQNERHLSINKEIVGQNQGIIGRTMLNSYYDEFNRSLVVLANPKTVVNDRYAPKSVKEKVIRGDQLVAVLKSMKSSDRSGKKAMLQRAERMLSRNIDDRKDYLKKYLEMMEMAVENQNPGTEAIASDGKNDEFSRNDNSVRKDNSIEDNNPIGSDISIGNETSIERDNSIEKDNSIGEQQVALDEDSLNNGKEASLICPRCGQKLVLRTAKRGDHVGDQFYGCSGFPKCRYTRKL